MRLRVISIMITLAVATALLPACALPGKEEAKAATVNGKVISLAEFEKNVEAVRQSLTEQGVKLDTPEGKGMFEQIRADILEQLIDTELMRQAAQQEGIVVSDADINARVEQIKNDVGGDEALKNSLKQAKLTMDEFRKLIVRDQILYERLYQKLVQTVPSTAEQVRVRHILVNTEKEATDIYDRLQKGADFASLAKEFSTDPGSKDAGGDLGFFPRGILDAAFEDLVFRLKVNEIGIVKTDYGYHVVQVLAREANRALEPQAQQLLGEEALNRYMEEMRSKATIERFVQFGPMPTPSQ